MGVQMIIGSAVRLGKTGRSLSISKTNVFATLSYLLIINVPTHLKTLSQNRLLTCENVDEFRDMIIGYSRVSTDEQDTALQRDALSAIGCDKIFEEVISSGKASRPQFQAALEYARSGDTIAVWRLDRLSRSLAELISTVQDLDERGVGLRSLTETIDTGTAGGKLIFHIFGALAEFERGVIRERTQEGLRAARRRGRIGGRPSALSASDMAMAKTLLADTEVPVAAIARRLCISPATLYRHFPGGRGGQVIAVSP